MAVKLITQTFFSENKTLLVFFRKILLIFVANSVFIELFSN
jgi:hypothetical protein